MAEIDERSEDKSIRLPVIMYVYLWFTLRQVPAFTRIFCRVRTLNRGGRCGADTVAAARAGEDRSAPAAWE